jgi:DEAD/DEAH box helicase domain-containing protein
MTAITTHSTIATPSILTRIDEVLEQEAWNISDELSQPARAAVAATVPDGLLPALSAQLQSQFPAGIYRHQALALEQIITGVDVALTTPTASGKSLVFITGALQILLQNPEAKVVALYPMKALGNDQFAKWQQAMAGFGLNVAVLDGDVPVKEREQLLADNQVLIMTPDVMHAWMMSNLHAPGVRRFREALRLVILDEAHVYDGVFGTSMAYLLRRLEACGPGFQLIASSATIGQVDTFLSQLTGRVLKQISAADDGSPRHEVAWRKIRSSSGGKGFNDRVELIMSLANAGVRFIAFADSRKAAELLASATRRGESDDAVVEEDELLVAPGILPYRSGIESQDRQRIEQALATGQLRGVIATSALELGVDIPGINCVILMGNPPSQKSLWQRAGRTGRHGEGCVLLLEDASSGRGDDLKTHLARPIEANHLCLENRNLEFAHVLCAAIEAQASEHSWNPAAFADLSPRFQSLLEGERDGGQMLERDLFELKTKAGDSPHRIFSLRSGKETTFEIMGWAGKMGSISFPQVMREAYPGAIYYHLATPFRVRSVKRNKAVVEVSRERRYTTTPMLQSNVFVTLRQAEALRSGSTGFLYGGEVQITERITGFRERRGSATHTELYGKGSSFHQTAFDRWLRSTGVCWTLSDLETPPEECGERILATFCTRFGVCRGDLGVGRFRCKQNPYGPSPVTGICIYDRIEGGLRLTDELFLHFSEIAAAAAEQAIAEQADTAVIEALRKLALASESWTTQISETSAAVSRLDSTDTVQVFQPSCPALYRHEDHHEEVTIITFMPGPEGLEYLVTLSHGATKRIKAPFIHEIVGLTQMMELPRSVIEMPLSAA